MSDQAVVLEAPSPPPVNWVDRSIRRFRMTWYVGVVCLLYFVGAATVAIAIIPAARLLLFILARTARSDPWTRAAILAAGAGIGFFASGLLLLVVIALFNAVLPTRIHAFRGGYFTIAAIPWYAHNGLLYLARYTFLPFVTFTPFGIWFLRAMGMKIGARATINTEYVSDACMISVGDDAVIGGSVKIFAHYGGGGHLTIAPVVIGARSTIGENATVMGDVIVGEGAVVLPHAVLLPGTRVKAGEKWGGVPARRAGRIERAAGKAKRDRRINKTAP